MEKRTDYHMQQMPPAGLEDYVACIITIQLPACSTHVLIYLIRLQPFVVI